MAASRAGAAQIAFTVNHVQTRAVRAADAPCYLCGEVPNMSPASVNRANSQHSTGPRSEAGKQRSSLNALAHGLTARTAVLPSEDPGAYEQHRRQFLDEYKPATPTETQLVQELADRLAHQSDPPP